MLPCPCRDKNFYPEGTGYIEEVGKGPGTGFNINIGWTKRGVGDLDYVVSKHYSRNAVVTHLAGHQEPPWAAAVCLQLSRDAGVSGAADYTQTASCVIAAACSRSC